jgi:hypothetical protein
MPNLFSSVFIALVSFTKAESDAYWIVCVVTDGQENTCTDEKFLLCARRAWPEAAERTVVKAR